MYSFKGWQNNKNLLFHQSTAQAMKNTCYCYTFYNENQTYVPVLTCNKKIIFVKKIFWLIVGIHWLLHSFCFLNTNTAITQQLIWTARMLEPEWWQVWREAWVWGQRKMSQVVGAFGPLDFTMLRPVLAWRAFLNLWTVYFFNFPNSFSGRSQPRITGSVDTESADTAVNLYLILLK